LSTEIEALLNKNWNDGTMELWNVGFKENGIQSAYVCIDFLLGCSIVCDKRRK
jgi:hypothetical protein